MVNTMLRIQLIAHGAPKPMYERYIEYHDGFPFAMVRDCLLELYPGFDATIVFSIEQIV